MEGLIVEVDWLELGNGVGVKKGREFVEQWQLCPVNVRVYHTLHWQLA